MMKRKSYVKMEFSPIMLEVTEALLKCSVRVSPTAVIVEDYHDYFHESDPTKYAEGDPFEIGFGDSE